MKLKSKKMLALVALLSGSLFLGACSQQEKEADTSNEPKQEEQKQEEQKQEEKAEAKTMAGADLEALLEVKEKKDGVLIVDVRSADEYGAGHIKDAINVPLDDIKADASMFDDYKDTPIILYCNTGKKSGEAAQILLDKGFKDITNADGVKNYEYKNLIKYPNITGKELEKRLEEGKYLIVDVRPVEQYKEGHLKDAINVPFDQVDQNLDKLPQDKDIILYCNTGTKSSEVAKQLEDKGYTNITNSIHGTKEYQFKELVKE